MMLLGNHMIDVKSDRWEAGLGHPTVLAGVAGPHSNGPYEEGVHHGLSLGLGESLQGDSGLRLENRQHRADASEFLKFGLFACR